MMGLQPALRYRGSLGRITDLSNKLNVLEKTRRNRCDSTIQEVDELYKLSNQWGKDVGGSLGRRISGGVLDWARNLHKRDHAGAVAPAGPDLAAAAFASSAAATTGLTFFPSL